jgi:hypothetical protein
MQWSHIVPRKARPKCQWCLARARWRCDFCLNAKPEDGPEPTYFPGMSVCDVHKERAEFLETRELLHSLRIADFPIQECVLEYLSKGGIPVVAALATILDQDKLVLEEVLGVCLRGGDIFAQLLAIDRTGNAEHLVCGLLHAVEHKQMSIAGKALSLLGVFAKHGVAGSMDALRRCAKTPNSLISNAAIRLLDTWGSAEQVTHPYRLGVNRSVVFPYD